MLVLGWPRGWFVRLLIFFFSFFFFSFFFCTNICKVFLLFLLLLSGEPKKYPGEGWNIFRMLFFVCAWKSTDTMLSYATDGNMLFWEWFWSIFTECSLWERLQLLEAQYWSLPEKIRSISAQSGELRCVMWKVTSCHENFTSEILHWLTCHVNGQEEWNLW